MDKPTGLGREDRTACDTQTRALLVQLASHIVPGFPSEDKLNSWRNILEGKGPYAGLAPHKLTTDQRWRYIRLAESQAILLQETSPGHSSSSPTITE